MQPALKETASVSMPSSFKFQDFAYRRAEGADTGVYNEVCGIYIGSHLSPLANNGHPKAVKTALKCRVTLFIGLAHKSSQF